LTWLYEVWNKSSLLASNSSLESLITLSATLICSIYLFAFATLVK